MKKLMSMMLGLSLTIGSAGLVFAQDKQPPPPPPTKDGQDKGDKKGKDDKGDKKGADNKGDKKGKDDKSKN